MPDTMASVDRVSIHFLVTPAGKTWTTAFGSKAHAALERENEQRRDQRGCPAQAADR
jgi:hypothetical protein